MTGPYESMPGIDFSKMEYPSSIRSRLIIPSPEDRKDKLVRFLKQDSYEDIFTPTVWKTNKFRKSLARYNGQSFEPNEDACLCPFCAAGIPTVAQKHLLVYTVVGTRFEEPPFSKNRSKRLWKKLRRKSAKPILEKRQLVLTNRK